MRDTPVIIDDVRAASRQLTPLGTTVTAGSCEDVRAAILGFAASKGWLVVDHTHFADWTHSLIGATGSWRLLDPLLEAPVRSGTVRAMRVSRVLHGADWVIEPTGLDPLVDLVPGLEIGLVDDAASSGSTLIRACGMVEAVGAVVTRVALCTASTPAREALREHRPQLQWHQFVSGAHRTIHLRDACPYLPHSGRPTASQPRIETSMGTIVIRMPSVAIKSGLWTSVFSDYRVLAATLRARSQVTAMFSAAVGREATVADLPLLGANVALPAYPRHEVAASTTLSSLC